MAQYQITEQHMLEIGHRLEVTRDVILSWFPEEGHKAWGQSKLLLRLKSGGTINKNTATQILRVLNENGLGESLNFFNLRVASPPEPNTYDVSFPSDTNAADIKRLARANSLTGFYRLTRHKFSEAEPKSMYVVDYLHIHQSDNDIHFTMYAVCSASDESIKFKGTVRRLGKVLFLAGRRTPDALSTLSFKMLFLQDEGDPDTQRSRIRWGMMTTKTLNATERNPASARILLEKTHLSEPKTIPRPSFKDEEYFKTQYSGTYTPAAQLYRAVLSLISNDIHKHPANMNKANPGPDLTLGVSQGTIDAITSRLVENLGPLKND